MNKLLICLALATLLSATFASKRMVLLKESDTGMSARSKPSHVRRLDGDATAIETEQPAPVKEEKPAVESEEPVNPVKAEKETTEKTVDATTDSDAKKPASTAGEEKTSQNIFGKETKKAETKKADTKKTDTKNAFLTTSMTVMSLALLALFH